MLQGYVGVFLDNGFGSTLCTEVGIPKPFANGWRKSFIIRCLAAEVSEVSVSEELLKKKAKEGL